MKSDQAYCGEDTFSQVHMFTFRRVVQLQSGQLYSYTTVAQDTPQDWIEKNWKTLLTFKDISSINCISNFSVLYTAVSKVAIWDKVRWFWIGSYCLQSSHQTPQWITGQMDFHKLYTLLKTSLHMYTKNKSCFQLVQCFISYIYLVFTTANCHHLNFQKKMSVSEFHEV